MLRIDGNASTMPAAARIKVEPRTAVGDIGFARQLSSSVRAPRPGAAPSAAALGPLPGMLALQEVRPQGESARRAIRRGKALLDTLGELQAALLDDAGPMVIAERLRSEIEGQREHDDDPALKDILDAIELRALVELAKLDRDATLSRGLE
jgi:hypothetical protein